jgi:phosphotransacetylase
VAAIAAVAVDTAVAAAAAFGITARVALLSLATGISNRGNGCDCRSKETIPKFLD